MSVQHNDDPAEPTRGAVRRTVKLGGIPLGAAGRAVAGIGQRLAGRPAALVSAELRAKTGEQIFRALGELKGGAMKIGQSLSVLEAALPDELAGPYRSSLRRLQEAAPALPPATVGSVLSTALGTDWRANFRDFQEKPAAAASIGQVHRAVWLDGRPVAVKIQYPGARQALLSDLRQLRRLAGPLGLFSPGIDVKALAFEAEARMAEELDSMPEASSQQAFAATFAGDPDITVPAVVCQAGDVLVSEWIEGVPLADIVAAGTAPQRDRAGLLLVRLLLDGPARAGLLHADPHPGNFRLIPDGPSWRLGVLDFGAVSSLPDGLPEPLGRAIRLTLSGDAIGAAKALTATGFLKTAADPAAVLDLLAPMVAPAAVHTFTFSRAWLRDQAVRAAGAPKVTNRGLDLPPDHLLIHRVVTGTVAMLCQLGATAPFRAELIRGLPGFVEPDVAIS